MAAEIQITGTKLALVAPLSLTDNCLAAPSFRAFRRKKPKLAPTIICAESKAPLWRVHFKNILSYHDSSSGKQLRELFAPESFHSAVFLENSPATQALAKLNIPQRLGFDVPELAKLVTQSVPKEIPSGPLPHRVASFLELARKLDFDPRKAKYFATPPLPQRPSALHLALAPDSDFGPAAEWPVESFLQFVKALSTEVHFKISLLSLYQNDARSIELAKALEALGDENIEIIEPYPQCNTSCSSAEHLAYLLQALPKFTSLVSSHSSLVHLAAHVGLPTVSLMGPHLPSVHRPLGKVHLPLTTHAECSPCYLTRCPLDHRCLGDLTPEAVAGAVGKFIQQLA